MSDLFDFGDDDGPNWAVKLPNGRPKCVVKGCHNAGQHMGKKNSRGETIYRKLCSHHHDGRHEIVGGYRHAYLKDYCENIDGRLGFVCTRTEWKRLEVDHVNNDHTDERPANFQTLCSSCHKKKQAKYGKLFSTDLETVWAALRANMNKIKVVRF